MDDGPVLESPEISEETGSSVPLTLAQRAFAAQKVWASAYAAEHRARRRASWVIALVLSVCVMACGFRALAGGSWPDQLGLTLISGSGPLAICLLASGIRLAGDRCGGTWAMAWVFLLVGAAAGGSGLFPQGEDFLGVLDVVASAGIGGVLSWGLHIPDDPSVDWDLVFFEQLTVAQSARGGHCYPPIIDSPRKAEEIAAAWLRRLGYPDALVSPVGADDGKDAASFGAVAQVKWTSRPIGVKDVRDLAGTGKPGQARFFFSRSGYTKPVLTWASDVEYPVQLFIMGADGNIFACNYRARRSLWHAPSHVPVASRAPFSNGMVGLSVVGGVCTLLGTIVFAYGTVHAFGAGQVLLGMFCAAVTLMFAFSVMHVLFMPVARIIRNVREGRRPGVGMAFRGPRLPEVDEGLPSDAFVGFEPDPIGRACDLGIDFWVFSRAVRRVVEGKKRSVV